MAAQLRDLLERRLTALRAERVSWTEHWAELARFIMPRRGRFIPMERDRGLKLNGSIINSTATMAVRIVASGMAGSLTSPAQPWFRLAPENPDLAEVAAVVRWIERVEKMIYRVLAASNFYQAINNVYEELALFGTAGLWQEDSFQFVTVFRPMTCGQYFLANDQDGIASIMYREFVITTERAVLRWPGKVSATVRAAYDRGDTESSVEICQACEPNGDRFAGSPGLKGWPYVSVYWEKGSSADCVLGVRGVPGPALAPRWHRATASDVYGRSPAMDALGDVKQLQVEERLKAKGLQRAVQSPLQGPPLANTNLDLAPDAYNAVASGQQLEIKPIYAQPPRIDWVQADCDRLEERINRALYADLFLQLGMLRRGRMTATEVVERGEEKLMQLGPVLTNTSTELLDPIIDRTFERILAVSKPLWPDGGMVPPPPKELAGAQIKVEYISVLHQAQKAVRTGSLARFLEYVGQLSALKPEALDKIDGEQTVDELHAMLGPPAGTVKPDDEVATIRQQRAERQRQAEALQAAAGAADIATKLGQAPIQNTALGELVNG